MVITRALINQRQTNIQGNTKNKKPGEKEFDLKYKKGLQSRRTNKLIIQKGLVIDTHKEALNHATS